MWFLMRAIFWLSIVFSLMPWPEESGLHSSPVTVWTKARDAVGSAIRQARTDSEKICRDSPIACLEAATKLGQFAADKPTDEAKQRTAASGPVAR